MAETAYDYWQSLSDEDKLEIMRMRNNEYSDFHELSIYEFIDNFDIIHREVHRGQIPQHNPRYDKFR